MIVKTLDSKSQPFISVIIPAFNESGSIAKTLRALSAQSYRGEYEVIVADNGSTDDTREIARRNGARVVMENHVKSAAGARQKGALGAQGQILLFTDADTIVPENWIEEFVLLFKNDPQLLAVSGMYDFYDGSAFLRIVTWMFNYYLFVVFNWHSGANMAVKKDIFTRVGGFNTKISISEDSELFHRIEKEGRVRRLSSHKVMTSARRFNTLGFFGGLWNYSSTYFVTKYLKKGSWLTFESGSVVKSNFITKRLPYAFIIALFFVGAAQVPPVKAEAPKIEHKIMPRVQQTLKKDKVLIHNYLEHHNIPHGNFK